MKICIALHQCMDLGGIINHTENLIGGLKTLGHTVSLKQFAYTSGGWDQSKSGDFEIGDSGIPFHQWKGWEFPAKHIMKYKTDSDLATARQFLNSQDIVIWTVPVPTKAKNNVGNHKWPYLYDLNPNVKQVAFIHDGNSKIGYPHLLYIADKLSGIACVHECAINSADHIPVPRAIIFNPQKNPMGDDNVPSWADKKPGFVNMQTFKAWKKVGELVESIAYMPTIRSNELREIAGRGIEYQYMTSEDKCKDKYYHWPKKDSDPRWFDGETIWNAALANGMNHHINWTVSQVDTHLKQARILVDPSWSERYSKIGGHWNRVVVDAMIRGAIPLAHKIHMGEYFFVSGVHYIDLDPGIGDPQKYADIIIEAGNMSEKQASVFTNAAREMLPYFDRTRIAQRVIDLAHGNVETTMGFPDPEIQRKSDDIMFHTYGVI